MLSVLIALVAGVLVAGIFKLTFVHSWWGVILPGLAAFTGVGVLALRRTGKMVEPVLKQVEKHIMGGRRELALKALRDGLSLGRWNPLLPGQLRVQLGVLEYAGGDMDAAEAELSHASRYPWLSRAYLGCIYFKKKDVARMTKAFETALKVGDKEGVLYTLYAYCLMATGKKAEAVAVLEKGLKKLPGDHRLQTNLELAKEGKKLKTAPYGDQWSRFALEGPVQPQTPQQLPKYMRGYAQRPGFRQRPQRRK